MTKLFLRRAKWNDFRVISAHPEIALSTTIGPISGYRLINYLVIGISIAGKSCDLSVCSAGLFLAGRESLSLPLREATPKQKLEQVHFCLGIWFGQDPAFDVVVRRCDPD